MYIVIVTKRAAIYARQSIDVSEGIERQVKRCAAIVEARGWRVVETYRDNDTSATKARGRGTAWDAMLTEAGGRKFDVIVAVDLDRLLRSVRDLVSLTDTGVAVLTVDGEIDLTTADGEFRGTMLAGIARFEVRRKSERQLRANEARRSSGLAQAGRRLYGYTTARAGQCSIIESEAIIVRSLFDRIARGESVRGIARDLELEGIPAATGKRWSPRRVRDMALNPRYGGDNGHPAIVSSETAEKVSAILGDAARRTTPGPAPRHLLSGLARCGVCGGVLSYRNAYLCLADLSHPTIKGDRLERATLLGIVTALIQRRPLEGHSVDKTAAIRQRLDELAKDRTEATELLLDRLVDKTAVRARLQKTAEESAELGAELDRLMAQDASRAVIDRANKFIDTYGALRTGIGTPDEVKANLIQVVQSIGQLGFHDIRALIRATLIVKVNPYRGALPRVEFFHAEDGTPIPRLLFGTELLP